MRKEMLSENQRCGEKCPTLKHSPDSFYLGTRAPKEGVL